MTSSRRNLAGLLLLAAFLCGSVSSAHALPAFARKYGLRCSACHEAWPMLNYFGQKFKDNGYQLMNDRDAPIWQNPSYWPVTFRITPFWHRESTDKVQVDTAGGGSAEQQVTNHGFDLSGLDFHTGGTLEKNLSFYVLPSSNSAGAFHFETVMARLDNLFGSSWLNLKLGKFELDNLVSEKRILTLTNISGVYQTYHFRPVGDNNVFGQIGDNQLGIEWMGHSYNDRSRISAALLSSNDGQVGLPSSNAYSGFFAASQAFDVGKLGVDRIGGYAMIGEAPTYFLTTAGGPVATPFGNAGGQGNKSFSREGFVGLFYFGKLDFLVVTQHGSDNAYFGTSTASNHGPSRGSAEPHLERIHGRKPLCLQSATGLHPAFRVGADVTTGLADQSLKPGEHRHVHVWIPLVSHHDQPRGLRLSQRVFVAAHQWNIAVDSRRCDFEQPVAWI